jgi:hypothetical protein
MEPLMTGAANQRGCSARRWLVIALGVMAMLIAGGVARAEGFKSPEACQAYTGEAHLNCLYAVIELQQSKLGKIEEELKAQKSKLGELSDQVESKASTSTIEKAAPLPPERPVYVPVPSAPMYMYPPYPYYGYGPAFGLYFGPRFYGGYYGPRYFGGPRFYGRGFRGRR